MRTDDATWVVSGDPENWIQRIRRSGSTFEADKLTTLPAKGTYQRVLGAEAAAGRLVLQVVHSTPGDPPDRGERFISIDPTSGEAAEEYAAPPDGDTHFHVFGVGLVAVGDEVYAILNRYDEVEGEEGMPPPRPKWVWAALLKRNASGEWEEVARFDEEGQPGEPRLAADPETGDVFIFFSEYGNDSVGSIHRFDGVAFSLDRALGSVQQVVADGGRAVALRKIGTGPGAVAELWLKADGEWRKLGTPPAVRGFDANLVAITPSGHLFVSDETFVGTRTMHVADVSGPGAPEWIKLDRPKALLADAAFGDGFVDVGFQENKGGKVEVSVWRYRAPEP